MQKDTKYAKRYQVCKKIPSMQKDIKYAKIYQVCKKISSMQKDTKYAKRVTNRNRVKIVPILPALVLQESSSRPLSNDGRTSFTPWAVNIPITALAVSSAACIEREILLKQSAQYRDQTCFSMY